MSTYVTKMLNILGMALNQYIIDTEDYYLHYITKLLFMHG